MPEIAYLECSRCGGRVGAEAPQTVCPVDGGCLYVRYDIQALKHTAKRENPARYGAASAGSLGMWRYRDVLPAVEPVTLGEGWTPMLQSKRYPGLLVKEEAANPTGSCEARGLGMAVSMARHYGLKHLAMASAGDAAGALAAYAAAAGIGAHLFLPKEVSFANYLEGVVYGAEVTLVEGSIPDCERMVGERMAAQRAEGTPAEEVWFDVSTRKEPFRVEGKKTMGYEMVEQMGWTYPEAVLYPAVGGVGLIAMWKAFEEMEALGWVAPGSKRPKMYAIEASTFSAGAETFAGGSPSPGGDVLSEEIVTASGGRALATDDAAMLASLLDWAREEGIFLSPEGAAAAAYGQLLGSGELKPADRVVLFNPGAGSKYVDTLAATMGVRRPVPRAKLPRSLPVGGIITPV